MRGARKNNGKYIFITPKTGADAVYRRHGTVHALQEVKAQQRVLEEERRELVKELECLNSFLRSLGEKVEEPV